MTSVPPTQPPAAPETDVRLTEAERDSLRVVLARWFKSENRVDAMMQRHVIPAVERIVAERVRVVEGERDRLRRWKDEALPVIDGLQDLGDALGLPLGQRITGPAAVEAARNLTARAESAEAAHAEAERLRALWFGENSRAQAELANEKAAHRALQAAVEALADGDLWEHADTLRALLPGGEER